MSLSRFGNKTLTGEDDLEIDKINITGEGIGINDNFGLNGQIIKKSIVDNTLMWDSETAYSASSPIILNGTQISFNTNKASNVVAIRTVNSLPSLSVGDTINLQAHNGIIEGQQIYITRTDGSGAINLMYNNPIKIYSNQGTSLKLLLDKSKLESYDNFDLGTTTNYITNGYIGNVSSNALLITTGDNTILMTGEYIQGNNNLSSILSFKVISLTDTINSSNFISSNGNVITTHGGELRTYGGDIDLIKSIGGTITYGELKNFSKISGVSFATSVSNIDKIYNAVIRTVTTSSINFTNFTDSGSTGSTKISISGNGSDNYIDGDDATVITGINTITSNTVVFLADITSVSGDITLTNGEITLTSGDMDIIDGDLNMINGDLILTNGTLNLGGGIDMNTTDITEIKALNFKDVSTASIVGGSSTNKIVLTNCDLSSSTNTQSTHSIPSTITGDKIFTGNITAQGNIIGDGSTNISSMNGITAQTIIAVGNITAQGNIIGDGSTNISSMDGITAQTIVAVGNIIPNGDIIASGTTNKISNMDLREVNNKYTPAGMYRSLKESTKNFIYKIVKPTDFMNDNDASGYNRCVISDNVDKHGYLQAYAGSQLFYFFDIPYGYKWTKFHIGLVNQNNQGVSGGTSTQRINPGYMNPLQQGIQGGIPTVSTYARWNLTQTIKNGGWSDGYDSSFGTSKDITDIKAPFLELYYAYAWNSNFYHKGGWLEFEWVGVPSV